MAEMEIFEKRIVALDESEMQLFRMLVDMPGGAELTVETDKMLAELLSRYDLVDLMPGDRVRVPEKVAEAFKEIWNDDTELQWNKQNWMYKCLEAGRLLYGVMTWEALKNLFAVKYVNTDLEEVKAYFGATPAYSQWFTERDGKLVLNGYEKNDYYKYLEKAQGDTPFYIPKREEVEELYDRGCLLSMESHRKLQSFIQETYGLDADSAGLKVQELYEAVNNRTRVSDAAEAFAKSDKADPERFAFASDEIEAKFIELFLEMSRDCRVRDNRGHDWFEMAAIMASRNSSPKTAKASNSQAVRRVKVGRNDPCPCGSGKKYKNCCGKN